MNNIKELNNGCKLNNLLKYHNLLSKARQVTDHEGLKFIETELKRAKEMFCFLYYSSVIQFSIYPLENWQTQCFQGLNDYLDICIFK